MHPKKKLHMQKRYNGNASVKRVQQWHKRREAIKPPKPQPSAIVPVDFWQPAGSIAA